MPTIAGWTPPSFHPDGALTAAELAPQSKTTIHDSSNRTTNNSPGAAAAAVAAAAAKLPSDPARFQWGERPPSCAVVFGGLNSMYVNPEVWILPLRWREKTVQLSPPSPEPEPQESEELQRGERAAGLAGLGFATTVRLKRAAGLAAATAREKVTAAAGGWGEGSAPNGGGTEDDNTWRPFHAGRVGGAGGAGAGRHRRASLPGGFATGAAALGLEILRAQGQQRQESKGGVVDGVGGDDRGGVQESAAEIEVSAIRRSAEVLSGAKLAQPL